MKKLIILLAAVVALYSCSDQKGGGTSGPPASGLPGDMYLIMDSAQWNGPLGKLIDSTFTRDMLVLNRTEPIFRMRWIDPRKLNFVLKQRRNLIFAVTLDQKAAGAKRVRGMFTQQSIDRIKSDTSFFMTTSTNLFAKGQEVMFLVGTTEKELIKKIRGNQEKITSHFDRAEVKRLTSTLFKSGQLKGVAEIMHKSMKAEIKIPFGFDLVTADSAFIWARQINPKDDKDIFIARKPYRSVGQFKKDSLIAFRDEVCKKHLFGDPERLQSYLITETKISYKPVMTREVNFHGMYAVEMRGLWRTNNLTMGGPFLSYAFVDEKNGLLYYIEGFTYAPGKEQREIMRELDVILNTFKFTGK
ncbi:MAG: DUF4837 family protein [Bacteroidetes bacterium]|nr:DUF4837 family protein [Bacteroidota bacterium]